MKVLRILGLLLVLALLVPARSAHAATLCGGNVTHTSSQSKLWGPASWSSLYDDAEWSGFVKYNPPSGGSCDIRFDYNVVNLQGQTVVGFRRSTSDTTKMQWDPSHCAIGGEISGYAVSGSCTYNGASSQVSNRVKLITARGTARPATVIVYVYEKDSDGNYQEIYNNNWTFN